MSNARQSLTQLLQAEFKKDSSVQKLCHEDSKKKLLQGHVSRAFDKFPCLVSAVDFEKFHQQFIDLMTKKIDKNTVEKYVADIMKLGCEELLDKSGKLNTEIIELMNWQELNDKIAAVDILSAYVSAVNMQVIEKAKSIIEQNMKNYQIFITEVRKNQLQWLNATLAKLNMPCNVKTSVLMEFLDFPATKPALLISAIGLLGYGLYKIWNRPDSHTKEKEGEKVLEYKF